MAGYLVGGNGRGVWESCLTVMIQGFQGKQSKGLSILWPKPPFSVKRSFSTIKLYPSGLLKSIGPNESSEICTSENTTHRTFRSKYGEALRVYLVHNYLIIWLGPGDPLELPQGPLGVPGPHFENQSYSPVVEKVQYQHSNVDILCYNLQVDVWNKTCSGISKGTKVLVSK